MTWSVLFLLPARQSLLLLTVAREERLRVDLAAVAARFATALDIEPDTELQHRLDGFVALYCALTFGRGGSSSRT